MPDPNKFNILDALIPILGGAAAAYSPRYLGAGVNAAAGLYGQRMNQKYDQQRLSIEQAFRDRMLEEQKEQTKQARISIALKQQGREEEVQARNKRSEAFAAQYGETDPNMSIDLDPAKAAIGKALESGGMSWGEAVETQKPAPVPKPEAEPRPDYPFTEGAGGLYDRRVGQWSVPPPTKPTPPAKESLTDAPSGEPTPRPLTEAQRIQALDRAYARLAKAEEARNEGAIAREQARIAQLEGQPEGAPTSGALPPGIQSEAGKKLAAKYGLQ